MMDGLRRAILERLVSCRERRLRSRRPDAIALRLVTWPPAATAAEAADVARRVDWFFAPLASRFTSVWVPTTADRPALEPSTPSTLVLLWKVRSRRLLSLLTASRAPFFIVDPDLHASTEEVEWRNLYARFVDRDRPRALREASGAAFDRLAREVGSEPAINVCGNGPGLRAIYERDCRGDVTIVCNAAVQSDRLLEHVRPRLIAFVNSPYFGPSAFARDHLARILRCVEAFGSYVLIPEGYGHDLLRSHYPSLASRIVALQLGRTFTLPARGALASFASANVLTSLMLPLAAALKPRVIRVWGCDGQPPAARGVWSYLPGLEPKIESVAPEHPAFARALPASDAYWQRTYAAHADHLDRLLTRLEQDGLRIVCCTPTAIPALATRAASAAEAPSNQSVPCK